MYFGCNGTTPTQIQSMASPEVESQWYVALFEEDCVRVMELLKDHPCLLSQGWESDPARVVEGSRLNVWMPKTKSTWKGRTALHVGARRGCTELVEQAIALCYQSEEKNRETGGNSDQETVFESDSKKDSAASSPFHDNAPPVSSEGGRQDVQNRASEGETSLATSSDVKQQGNSSERVNSSEVNSKSEIESGVAQQREVIDRWTNKVEEKRTADKKIGSLAFGRWKRKLTKVKSKARNHSDNDVLVSMEDLLPLKDGEYKLDALAMAALHGNTLLLFLLMHKSKNPLSVWHPDAPLLEIRPDGPEHMADVRTVTEQVIATMSSDEATFRCIFDAYSKHRDFNFLPRELYLFHFLCTDYFRLVGEELSGMVAALVRELLWDEINRHSEFLWESLLTNKDGQGRAPLHVAVDEGTVLTLGNLLRQSEVAQEVRRVTMIAEDGAGRTACHRAIALGTLDAVSSMRDTVWATDQDFFRLAFNQPWRHSMQDGLVAMQDRGMDVQFAAMDELSVRNGFRGRRVSKGSNLARSSPLHSALIHNRTKILDTFAENINHRQDFPFAWIHGLDDFPERIYLSNLDLATLTCEVPTVKRLLKQQKEWESLLPFHLEHYPRYGDERLWLTRWLQQAQGLTPSLALVYMEGLKVGFNLDGRRSGSPWRAIHLAANSGNYEMLKTFVDTPTTVSDPYAADFEENTVLHHAMKVRKIEFHTHLLDYVNCEHILSNDPRDIDDMVVQNSLDSIVERQGCINLLLQAGCDIFKTNKDGQVPYPMGNLSTNPSFLSWWYEKQSKEFGGIQNTMSFAANAISVTATLVATASYVGPLQPPLGYGGDPNQIQVKNIWVRIFLVCDTLSFYLAIAAITFSLIPSLPIPQQPMRDELRRTRLMVTSAVAILLPSISCILVAFASSAIAVVTAHGLSSTGGSLTVITAAIGGAFCLLGFLLFSIRLLGFVFPRNSWVRKIYNITTF